MSITSEWNAKQKRLTEIIRKPNNFSEAKEIFLHLHSNIHMPAVYNAVKPTILSNALNGLQPTGWHIMPTIKDVTIAWDIWHITRIEDLTVNLLINGKNQVFNDDWQKKLNTTVKDTGNVMSDDEIIALSKGLNITQLIEYRNAVGNQTKLILNSLSTTDMKIKVDENNLKKILAEGGVLEASSGLLSFWGKKDVAGIILMPVTRHQLVHINDAIKLKKQIKAKKEYYLY